MHNKLKIDLNKANNAEDMKILKDFIRVRIPLAVKLCKEKDAEGTNLIKVEELREIIKNFKLPTRFQLDNVINPFIEKFKEKENCVNYKSLIEDLVDVKELNDFFNFKDKYIEKIEKKIKNSKEQMITSYNLIKQEEQKKHLLMKELENNVRLHAEERLKNKDNKTKVFEDKINGLQPSSDFSKMIFSNIKENSEKYKEFESKFSAHPSLRKEVIVQTRYGANPPFKDTKWITQPNKFSGMFLSESDRFNSNGNYFQDYERQLRTNKYTNKINIIKFYNDQNENKNNMENMLRDQKKLYSLLQRTEKMHQYEMINKIRNDLVE